MTQAKPARADVTAQDFMRAVEQDRGSWMLDAACRGKTDMMFPHPAGSSETNATAETLALEEAGKALCRTCPVIAECQAWAAAYPATDGTLAGLSKAERAHGKSLMAPRPVKRYEGKCHGRNCSKVPEPGAKYCSLKCSRSVTEAA